MTITTIAVANQKGGVGKTTTTVNLGAALAALGHETILIDLDPQGNASTGLGIGPEQRTLTSYDLLAGETDLNVAACKTGIPGLSIVPATGDLTSADIDLSQSPTRTRLLEKQLSGQKDRQIVLIDCPPALGLLTVNAMLSLIHISEPTKLRRIS